MKFLHAVGSIKSYILQNYANFFEYHIENIWNKIVFIWDISDLSNRYTDETIEEKRFYFLKISSMEI